MQDSLKDKAADGVVWKTVERIVSQVVHFAVGIVLARLLNPSDYGTVGLLAIFFAIAGTFQDSGFGMALVQKKNRTQEDFSTVFLFSIAASLIIYTILFFSAPLIANFYNVPILTDITRVSSLSFIISGLTGVQYAKLNIDLNFRFMSIMSIVGLLISAVTGITLAYMGWGVWALVWQGLISSIITGIVIWVSSGWHPSFVFSVKSFRQLFNYGGKLLTSNLINTVYNNLYTLVIGKVFNPATVGQYNRANGYAQMPMNIVNSLSMGVNFPILAKIQDDDERLLRAYTKLMRVPMYVLYPILVGVIVVARPLITVMIGEKWLPCVPMLQILCVGYMFMPLSHTNLNLLFVKGRTDLTLKMEFIKKPVAFLLLFVSIPFGIIWMVAGRAFYSVLVFFYNTYYTKKILNYGWKEQLVALVPIYVNVAIMAVLIWSSMICFENDVIKLSIGIPVGIASYIIVSVLMHDESFYDVKNIILTKFLHRK